MWSVSTHEAVVEEAGLEARGRRWQILELVALRLDGDGRAAGQRHVRHALRHVRRHEDRLMLHDVHRVDRVRVVGVRRKDQPQQVVPGQPQGRRTDKLHEELMGLISI